MGYSTVFIMLAIMIGAAVIAEAIRDVNDPGWRQRKAADRQAEIELRRWCRQQWPRAKRREIQQRRAEQDRQRYALATLRAEERRIVRRAARREAISRFSFTAGRYLRHVVHGL